MILSNRRFLVTGGSGFIGTHLMSALICHGAIVHNIDINHPKLKYHTKYWSKIDIKDIESLMEFFISFSPTHVLHLAAKANLRGRGIEDFSDNTIGTENIVNCINSCKSIRRYVHFSTQYVVKPGIWPKSEEYLLPYTSYGMSKAVGEKVVRANCNCCWTILRPTNVWGPYHPFFPYELWKFLKLRLYIHPGYKPVKKYYSYITNAIDQILGIINADDEIVCRRVFYITDPPIDNAEWMNAFSIMLSGKKVKRIPLYLWKSIAKIGDLLQKIGLRFPMSSERFFRLTVNENIPFQPTIDITGLSKVSLEEGVSKSVLWYKTLLAKGNR